MYSVLVVLTIVTVGDTYLLTLEFIRSGTQSEWRWHFHVINFSNCLLYCDNLLFVNYFIK